jgi:hypothetical protein
VNLRGGYRRAEPARHRIYEAGKAGKAEALLGTKCISVSNGYSGGGVAEAHFGTPGRGEVDITITMPCEGNEYVIRDVPTRQLFTFKGPSR